MGFPIFLVEGSRRFGLRPGLCFTTGDRTEDWSPFGAWESREVSETWQGEARHAAGTFHCDIAREGGFFLLRCRFVASGEVSGGVLQAVRWEFTLAEGFPPGDRLIRRCLPYDVWGSSAVLPFRVETPVDRAEYWRAAVFEPGREDEALGVSVRLPADWLHRFGFGTQFFLESRADLPLAPGTVLEGDAMAFTLRSPVDAALAGPPGYTVARLPVRAAPAHTGWNSWDHYRLTVTQEHILENLAQIRRHDWLRAAIRTIVIDDGWEDRVGNWEPNEKFGRGMAWVAGKIREAGFVPGLWAAPFFAEAGSLVYDEHPDWFVQFEGERYRPFALVGCGPPWGDRAYLDPTRPEVVDFIFHQWRKFRRWGFRSFKTDFLVNPFKLPRKGNDPGAPPDEPGPDLSGKLQFANAEAGIHRCHRQCMTALRAAIGEDSFWLGCGSIWATGAGVMDASRVSADISVRWDDLVKCGRNAFLNQHAHGRIWLNDPDFLVVRGCDTAVPELVAQLAVDDPSTSRPAIPDSFTLDEARMWASLVLLSGGVVTLSDPIGLLNGAGLEILKQVVTRLSGVPGRVTAWSGDLPRVVVQTAAGRTLAGVFNWSDQPANGLAAGEIPGVAIGKTTWRDVWSGGLFSAPEDWAGLSLGPHSCALLESTAA